MDILVYENMTNMSVLHYTGNCTSQTQFKIKTQGAAKDSFIEDWQINDKARLKLILGGQQNNSRTILIVNNNEE